MAKFLNVCVLSVITFSLNSYAMQRDYQSVQVNLRKPQWVKMGIIVHYIGADRVDYAGSEYSGAVIEMNSRESSHIRFSVYERYFNFKPALSHYDLRLRLGNPSELILSGFNTLQKRPLPPRHSLLTIIVDEHGKVQFVTNDEL